MPEARQSAISEQYDFDRRLHGRGTKGYDGRCTMPRCDEPPVVSRHRSHPGYPNGWWEAYCRTHADETAERAAARE